LHNWYENKRIKIKAFERWETRDQNYIKYILELMDGKKTFDFMV
jgi:hypothetical protein